MSVYSKDSLEDADQDSPRCVTSVEDSFCDNLDTDTRSNETAPGADRGTRISGGRNAIIANAGFAIVSPWRNQKNVRAGNVGREKRKSGSTGPHLADRCSKTGPKGQNRRCSLDGHGGEKPDKKLGNVLAPWIRPARKERSYLELYHRRFNAPSYTIRSPEGSTLSICGDSQPERLTEEEEDSLPGTSRDDQSELSFYRRLIEPRPTDRPLRTARSFEIAYQRPDSKDSNVFPSLDIIRNGASDDKPKKIPAGYRPYTIEEYKTLTVPKPDRSLGPDRVEIQAKESGVRNFYSDSGYHSDMSPGAELPARREWLMRRRSYGNSVSARNRQQILLHTQKLKSKRGAVKKCILPPLKDHEVNAKGVDNSSISPPIRARNPVSNGSDKLCTEYSKKSAADTHEPLSRKTKKLDKASSFCSSLNSCNIAGDIYLESLRQRHLHEKRMADRIIHQTLRS